MAELSVTSTDSPKHSLFTILDFPKLIKKKIDIPTMGIKKNTKLFVFIEKSQPGTLHVLLHGRMERAVRWND